jgi:hypothetical protein
MIPLLPCCPTPSLPNDNSLSPEIVSNDATGETRIRNRRVLIPNPHLPGGWGSEPGSAASRCPFSLRIPAHAPSIEILHNFRLHGVVNSEETVLQHIVLCMLDRDSTGRKQMAVDPFAHHVLGR